MKTVKRGQEVKRMSDEQAMEAVAAGWAYCPKAEWKRRQRGEVSNGLR